VRPQILSPSAGGSGMSWQLFSPAWTLGNWSWNACDIGPVVAGTSIHAILYNQPNTSTTAQLLSRAKDNSSSSKLI